MTDTHMSIYISDQNTCSDDYHGLLNVDESMLRERPSIVFLFLKQKLCVPLGCGNTFVAAASGKAF